MAPRVGLAALAALVLAPCACASLAACWLTSSFGALESGADASPTADAAIEATADVAIDVLPEAAADAGNAETAPPPGDAGCMVDAYVSSVLADDPLAYWRLDEDAGTTAHDLQGTYDGTYQGGVTLGAAGILPGDTAASFDGDSGMVEVGAKLAFLNTSPFSVEAWIKAKKIDGEYRGVLSNESPSIASRFGYLVYLEQSDAGVATGFERWNAGSSSPTLVENAVTANAWAHLVGTFDGQTMLLYVNGAPVATASSSLKITESGSFVIAALNSGQTASFFAGTIDEVAVYDHPVSAQCIQAHYQLGTGHSP